MLGVPMRHSHGNVSQDLTMQIAHFITGVAAKRNDVPADIATETRLAGVTPCQRPSRTRGDLTLLSTTSDRSVRHLSYVKS